MTDQDYHFDPLTPETFARIEYLIHTCLWEEKGKLIDKLLAIQYEIEGESFIEWLEERQPGPGDRTPHTITEMKAYSDYLKDKEDFHNQRFKK